MEDGSKKVLVENPYEFHIIAGTLQGLLDALEKSESSVTREENNRDAVECTYAIRL